MHEDRTASLSSRFYWGNMFYLCRLTFYTFIGMIAIKVEILLFIPCFLGSLTSFNVEMIQTQKQLARSHDMWKIFSQMDIVQFPRKSATDLQKFPQK